jgi:transcriptional regulator with XRE-family HTH domain
MVGMAKPSPSHAGDPALIALGMAIRAERSKIGLSQESLAHDTGLDRSYMGGIERGEHNVAVINLLKICHRLEISLSALAGSASL